MFLAGCVVFASSKGWHFVAELKRFDVIDDLSFLIRRSHFAGFCHYFSPGRQFSAVSEFQSCRNGLGRALRDYLVRKMKKIPSIQINKLVNTMSLTQNPIFMSGTSVCMLCDTLGREDRERRRDKTRGIVFYNLTTD